MAPSFDHVTVRQSLRFLIVGGLTVLIDLAVYWTLLWAGLAPSPAKAIAFVAGTLFAYVANRLFTFEGAAGGAGTMARFALVYAVNLGVNVTVNALVLLTLGATGAAVLIAFVAATAVSATLNFLGMKHWAFAARAPRSAL